MNKVYLVGRVAQKPEFSISSNGVSVIKIRLATHVKNFTEWHNVVAFNDLAEVASKNVEKGQKLFVEGRIQTSEYTDEFNNKKSTVSIVAKNLEFFNNNKNITFENNE